MQSSQTELDSESIYQSSKARKLSSTQTKGQDSFLHLFVFAKGHPSFDSKNLHQ